jgi:hypothetical protein
MTTSTIIAMVTYNRNIIGRVINKLGTHLPLLVVERDEMILSQYFSDMVFPVPVLKAAAELCDRKGQESIFKVIVTSVMRTDVHSALEGDHRPRLWDAISQGHIALFAQNLPKGSLISAFCQLCLGQKSRSLSEDPSMTEAFFSSRSDEGSGDGALLSLFLMTWPRISAEFLLALFEKSLPEYDADDAWGNIPTIVSKVQDPVSRGNIAHGIPLILKRRYGVRMNPDMRSAVKALNALEKNGKLPRNYANRSDDFDHNEILKMLGRMFGDADGRQSFSKEQRRTKAQK